MRNNLRTDESFVYVEKLKETRNPSEDNIDNNWEIIAVDADWATQLEWHRTHVMLGESKVEIRWVIPVDTNPGAYRIRHIGYHKVPLKNSEMTISVIREYSGQFVSGILVILNSKP